MPTVHAWQSLDWYMSILRALIPSGKPMTASVRSENSVKAKSIQVNKTRGAIWR